MTRLAIDTAGAYCSAALALGDQQDNGKVLTRFEPMARGQAERILPMIEELMQLAGLGYSDLEKIICSVGPGSFTGVRIGIALAKGLALASRTPLVGAARTLVLGQKFARMTDFSVGRFAVVIDAGRGEIYTQLFSAAGGLLEPVTQPMLLSLDEAAGFFSTKGVEAVVGPALDAGVRRRLATLGEGLTVIDGQAEDLLDIEERLFDCGDAVRPLYLRAADAKPQVGKALQRQS